VFFFCLSLFWCKDNTSTSNSSHHHHTPRSKHHTPRFTSNSTQHQTPRSLHTTPIKLATTPSPSNGTRNHDTVWTRPPRDGWRNGAVSRQNGKRKRKNTLPIVLRSLYNCISLESRPDVKNTRPVTLTREEACPPPDWRRELRHAQKGRGAENEAGQKGGASRDKKACGKTEEFF